MTIPKLYSDEPAGETASFRIEQGRPIISTPEQFSNFLGVPAGSSHVDSKGRFTTGALGLKPGEQVFLFVESCLEISGIEGVGILKVGPAGKATIQSQRRLNAGSRYANTVAYFFGGKNGDQIFKILFFEAGHSGPRVVSSLLQNIPMTSVHEIRDCFLHLSAPLQAEENQQLIVRAKGVIERTKARIISALQEGNRSQTPIDLIELVRREYQLLFDLLDPVLASVSERLFWFEFLEKNALTITEETRRAILGLIDWFTQEK